MLQPERQRDDCANKLALSIRDFVTTHYEMTLADPSWKPPANGSCWSPMPIELSGGEAVIDGTTGGTENEFGAKITCGNSFALDGPQAYFRVKLMAGASYTITLLPSFAARMYLFGTTCDPVTINAECSSSGLPGELAKPNETYPKTAKPTQTGGYTIAVDSRSLPYWGTFKLTIERL